ncbi:MAG: hypothetical protein JWP44_3498 [Mucilaginibacter sp.]|nr:hypothetical protein [Mucilaginibacter sp.]
MKSYPNRSKYAGLGMQERSKGKTSPAKFTLKEIKQFYEIMSGQAVKCL